MSLLFVAEFKMGAYSERIVSISSMLYIIFFYFSDETLKFSDEADFIKRKSFYVSKPGRLQA
jgi:hypothetical protein